MKSFTTILTSAETRHAKAGNLEQYLPRVQKTSELAAQGDAFFLNTMSRRIFRAGLKHSMVDNKWPNFENAFRKFSIESVRLFSDEQLELLMQDKNLIRHWGKLKSVRANAQAIHELKQEYAGVGAYLADWPNHDLTGLWDDLKRRFSQLGGMSGPYFLRMVERDTFILTNDVLKALNYWGLYQGKASSKKDKKVIQSIFNQWHNETDRPYSHLSRILAMSID